MGSKVLLAIIVCFISLTIALKAFSDEPENGGWDAQTQAGLIVDYDTSPDVPPSDIYVQIEALFDKYEEVGLVRLRKTLPAQEDYHYRTCTQFIAPAVMTDAEKELKKLLSNSGAQGVTLEPGDCYAAGS